MLIFRPGDTRKKDPDAFRFFGGNWERVFPGKQISASEWIVTGPDGALTMSNAGIVSDLLTRVMLAGGTRGATYTVTNRVTTNSTPPEGDDRTFYVEILDR